MDKYDRKMNKLKRKYCAYVESEQRMLQRNTGERPSNKPSCYRMFITQKVKRKNKGKIGEKKCESHVRSKTVKTSVRSIQSKTRGNAQIKTLHQRQTSLVHRWTLDEQRKFANERVAALTDYYDYFNSRGIVK